MVQNGKTDPHTYASLTILPTIPSSLSHLHLSKNRNKQCDLQETFPRYGFTVVLSNLDYSGTSEGKSINKQQIWVPNTLLYQGTHENNAYPFSVVWHRGWWHRTSRHTSDGEKGCCCLRPPDQGNWQPQATRTAKSARRTVPSLSWSSSSIVKNRHLGLPAILDALTNCYGSTVL